MKTKVLFLIENNSNVYEKGTVFAYFPEEKYSYDPNLFTCYAHIGQHSACHIDYAKECKEAQYRDFSDLMQELFFQGYKDLQVINKQVRECHRPPTKAEIKFGEGATHYRAFYIGDILHKSGEIKKWFVSPDDSLRYYTS